jgi:hypothetical protein
MGRAARVELLKGKVGRPGRPEDLTSARGAVSRSTRGAHRGECAAAGLRSKISLSSGGSLVADRDQVLGGLPSVTN